MDYLSTFAISASGMNVEKTRVDITALNLANMHSTRSIDGGPYQPMRVVSGEQVSSFENALDREGTALAGARILYDTSNVLHHYRTDQHVAAALELFSSVALLFWYVMRIFLASRR